MSAQAATARGRFSDGITAGVSDVDVTLAADAVLIAASDGRSWRWRAADVRRLPDEGEELGLRLTAATAPDARLLLGDSGLLPALRQLYADLDRDTGARARDRVRLMLGFVLTVALLVGAYFGLPLLAAVLAPTVPQSWQQALGARSERAVASLLSGSATGGTICTTPSGDAAFAALMTRLVAAAQLAEPPHVTVLDIALVNAFALPGNRLLVTRGMVDFSETPDELAGVLAHELGHLVHADPLSALLARLEWTGLTTLLFGGSSLSSFGETLVFLSYSRRAEARADATGLGILAKAGIDSAGFAASMRRMGKARASGGSYLDSHPAAEDRAAAIERQGAGGGAALEAEAWRDLKRVCTGQAPFSVS